MYTPEYFAVSDQLMMCSWIERWCLGKLITTRNGKLEVNSFPFYVDREKKELLSFMPKNNHQWQSLLRVDDLLVVFNGPRGYVSPHWYSSPNEDVPAWNHVEVQVKGKPELVKTDAASLEMLDKLCNANEACFGEGWSIGALDQNQLQRILREQVFFRIQITSMKGEARLSQNRTKMDRVGSIRQLSASHNVELNALSQLMTSSLKSSEEFS